MMSGQSSADPHELDVWVTASRGLDGKLSPHHTNLAKLQADFTSKTKWGHFDASSMIGAFKTYIGYNDTDAQWTSTIAGLFRKADSSGGVVSLPDAVIAAGLKAAGLTGGRQSVTFDDPVLWGEPPTSGYANDPINTASGNFVETEVDLAFTGVLHALRFSRTFNSRSDRVGPFGRGWASWATTRLRAGADGAHWESPDGQRTVIPVSANGTGYRRVVGIHGLVVPGETGLALEWFGGGQWEFDAEGLPVAVQDGPGTRVQFGHEQGRLVWLAHEGGKRLDVVWDGDRIVGLVCSDGRRVAYRYDNAGNLIEVDGGPGGVRRYELDAQGRVLAVLDADGVVLLRNTYDADGRVLGQVSVHGRRSRTRYLPGHVTIVDDEDGGPVNTYLHDEHGRLTGVIDGHGAELTKVYDEWGNPTVVTDRNGAVTLQQWDNRARLTRQRLPSGAILTFTYDDADRVLEVAASTGAVTRYRYEGAERSPVEIVDPEGGVTRMEVADGLVRRVVDPDGVEVRFGFDSDGNITSITDAYGNTGTLERDAAGRITAAVSPTGWRTELIYDQAGRPIERRGPGGAVWRFEYTSAGRLAATVDPTNARIETRYGTNGEAEQVIDALGHVTSRRFDALGNLVGMVAPDGAKWQFSYDALCRLVGIHDPAGGSWLREHDADGNLIASIDPVGSHRTATVDNLGKVRKLDDGATSVDFEFDELGRATVQRRPDGTELRATYDRCGRRTSVTDPLGRVTRYTYTPAGRIAQVTSPLGHATTFEYDRAGRMVIEIYPLGHRRTYRYDAEGRVTRITAPGGQTEWFGYDDTGLLATRRRQGGGVTRYAYDVAGRLTEVTDPTGGVSRFGYDPRGQLVEAIDANGAVTRYAINARGWLTEVTDPLGGVVEYRYNEIGRLVAETDQLGRVTRWEYDPAGQLTRRLDAAGNQIRWSYDQSGRLAGYTAGETTQITIERDSLGRAVVVDEPGLRHELAWDPLGRLVAKRSGDLELTWQYDADGRQVAVGYPDGTQTTYTYDAASGLTGVQHPVLGPIQLSRDEAGRLVGLDAAGRSERWSYHDGELVGRTVDRDGQRQVTELVRDLAGRVVTETRDSAVCRYRYDPTGQLITADAPQGTWSFSYDPAGRLTTETSPNGPTDYTYDAAGQLRERRRGDGVTQYTYDAAGRRMGETGPDRDRTFTWDALGYLTGIHQRSPAGESTTRLTVDAFGDLAAVDGTPLLWDPTGFVSQLRWLGGTAIIGDDERAWATIDPAGGASWLDADWQGSIGTNSHDPWGLPRNGATPNSPGALQLGWRGELEINGLVWLRNRAYDPNTRAFLSPDPLPAIPGTATAANPYHYANNDPLGWLDPLGLRPMTDADLAAYRQAHQGFLDKAGHWIGDHWDYIAAGAVMVAGGALMVFGGPAGMVVGGALMSGGLSYIQQKATTGKVDWGNVIKDAAIGGALGGLGAAAGGLKVAASISNPILRGMALGAGESLVGGAVTRGAHGQNPFDPKAMATDVLLGAGTGGLGGPIGNRLRLSGTKSAASDLADTFPRPPGVGDPRTVAVLKTPSGGSYPGRSGFPGEPHPAVQEALDGVPENVRPPFHGECAEIDSLSQALDAGDHVAGGVVSTARVRGPNSPAHGTAIPPCPSCQHVLDKMGVTYR
jgi:RHS repeat-associated protein